MRLTYERVAMFFFVVAFVSFSIVAIESIIDSHVGHEAFASDKKCKAETIDESLCVLGIPDPDFNDKSNN